MTGGVEVRGHCDPRFEAVQDAFVQNFEQGLEVGASFAATVDGEFVVDIWAGYADAAGTRPWERDTLVNVYSTTKAMAAICTLMLVDRGQLELDAPVEMARIQPAFVEAGVWIRPFGRLVYTMPPFVMTAEDVDRLTGAMVEVLRGYLAPWPAAEANRRR